MFGYRIRLSFPFFFLYRLNDEFDLWSWRSSSARVEFQYRHRALTAKTSRTFLYAKWNCAETAYITERVIWIQRKTKKIPSPSTKQVFPYFFVFWTTTKKLIESVSFFLSFFRDPPSCFFLCYVSCPPAFQSFFFGKHFDMNKTHKILVVKGRIRWWNQSTVQRLATSSSTRLVCPHAHETAVHPPPPICLYHVLHNIYTVYRKYINLNADPCDIKQDLL